MKKHTGIFRKGHLENSIQNKILNSIFTGILQVKL